MKTVFGDVTVQLFPEKAPLTVANFLRYIDLGLYDGASFFRIVKAEEEPHAPAPISVIQGGLQNNDPRLLSPVCHEGTNITELRHLDTTVSMARGKVGSARGAFFICIGDQPELDFGGKRQPDGQGFAAFGQVVAGMSDVRKAWERSAVDKTPATTLKIYHAGRITIAR